MNPIRINVVYQNNNMPADVLPPIRTASVQAVVTWSRRPQPASDAVVYFNHYTYNRRQHDRIAPNALRILYMYEPVAVDPVQYTKTIWKQFDVIFTWNPYLTTSGSVFRFDAGMYYDLPYTSMYGVHQLPDGLPDPADRERAICQICGDKYSLMPEQLYSERRRIARWFHHHGSVRMDVYGFPSAPVPNYCGPTENKAETFSRYRYALCLENTYHLLWSKGYITEKLLDCMYALTVPVYYGASNIEEIVPASCFIDYRKFTTLDTLNRYLEDLTDEEYLNYARNIRTFLQGYDAPRKHSATRLYESVASLCRNANQVPHANFPKDYFDHARLAAKAAAFGAVCLS